MSCDMVNRSLLIVDTVMRPVLCQTMSRFLLRDYNLG